MPFLIVSAVLAPTVMAPSISKMVPKIMACRYEMDLDETLVAQVFATSYTRAVSLWIDRSGRTQDTHWLHCRRHRAGQRMCLWRTRTCTGRAPSCQVASSLNPTTMAIWPQCLGGRERRKAFMCDATGPSVAILPRSVDRRALRSVAKFAAFVPKRGHTWVTDWQFIVAK